MNEPSFEEIANAANVSKMSVSRALSGSKGVSKATRQRIKELAKKMGYRPNPLIDTLMTHLRQRRTLSSQANLAYLSTYEGTFPNKLLYATHRAMYEGAHQRAEELGFGFTYINWSEIASKPSRINSILHSRGVIGVAIAPVPHKDFKIPLKWDDFSVAAIGFSFSDPPNHRSASAEHHAVLTSVEKLLALGYRQIGFCLHGGDFRFDDTWLGSFLARQYKCRDIGNIPPLLLETLDLKSFQNWYEKYRPDCILAGGSGFYDLSQQSNLKIPEEVGLAVLNRTSECTHLSGIDRNNGHQLGSMAVDLLSEQIHHNERGIPQYPQTVLTEVAWISSTTTRPVDSSISES